MASFEFTTPSPFISPFNTETGFFTVIVHFAVLLPSDVLTVIVAVPADFAVTTPDEETVATLVLDELQVTDLLLAFEGDTVAERDKVSPFSRVALLLFNETLVTEIVVD